MTKKTEYVGKESGKSSLKYFGGPEDHPGYGARTGDGKTTNRDVAGKIRPEFKGK